MIEMKFRTFKIIVGMSMMWHQSNQEISQIISLIFDVKNPNIQK